MSNQIKVINATTDERWDEFVLSHPQGIIYHHSLWQQVVAKTYGFEPFYIALENEITHQFEGILPFMIVKSWLTGNRMVSLPLTSYCPPLMPEEKFPELMQFIKKRQLSLDYIELKHVEELKNGYSTLEKQTLFTTHVLELSGNLDKLLKSFHNSSVRRRIKKAEKNKLKFRIGENEQDLKAFYRLEVKVRKKHGLPPQPYSFFKNMWDCLKPENYILLPLIVHNGKVIAATIILKFKDTFYYEYSAADSKFFHLGANQKLIWETIKIAHNEGAKKFDFGRSATNNQSLIRFKERWAAKSFPLYYYYFPHIKNIHTNRTNKLWHKLLNFANRHFPLSLLQIEGKLLYHHLG